MHMVRDCWDHFTMTGSVHDYLEYKKQEMTKANQNELRGDRDRGHECDDYGYGAYRDANQRI